MKTKSFLNCCTVIIFSCIALACVVTGCHNSAQDIRQYGYPSFDSQKLKQGNLLLPTKDSTLAKAMKNVNIPENNRDLLSIQAFDLPYWRLPTRALPTFNDIASIGMNIEKVEAVNVKEENVVPFIQRVYLFTRDSQLYYTADWAKGGLATLPQNVVTFSSNSYRWAITSAGKIYISEKIDPFVAVVSGIKFEILYQNNATG